VSIGSVYQYFPDEQAIFVAVHQRHKDQLTASLRASSFGHAASFLDDLMRAIIEGMIDGHSSDPELHQLLPTKVLHRAEGTRLCRASAWRIPACTLIRSNQSWTTKCISSSSVVHLSIS
jgi:AcrR family transcriptional regulator